MAYERTPTASRLLYRQRHMACTLPVAREILRLGPVTCEILQSTGRFTMRCTDEKRGMVDHSRGNRTVGLHSEVRTFDDGSKVSESG